jgi:two-component system sensor histidine kinase ArlS
MRKMTQQLLDLASANNASELSYKTFDLVGFCIQVARLLKYSDGRKIEVIAETKPLFITADQMKLKQLMLILLDNAWKYNKDHIEIRLESEKMRRVIRVRDYGIGIPQEEIPHVFERFYRVDLARHRKTGGTGLGLSIAKSIVQQHQGEISITSEEQIGTEVTISFPEH